jgi:RHS repeat-associated protein
MSRVLPRQAENPTSSQTYFHHQDWLGSERVTTDASGTTVSTCSNLPFGDGASCSPNQIANALFTGDEHDAESNTEHTLFRQMSGTQGRWLSPDPYDGSMDITNPQSFNRYAYVLNDPINFMDFLGLDQNQNCTTANPCTATLVFDPPPLKTGTADIGDGLTDPQRMWDVWGNGLLSEANLVAAQRATMPGWNDWRRPTLVPPQAQTVSWWGTFGSSLVNDFSLQDHNGKELCFAVFLQGTLSQLNPLTPSATTVVEPALQTASAVQVIRAGQYAASATNVIGGRGLLYPLKSSIFRGMLAKADTLASKSVGFAASVDVAMIGGLTTETQSLLKNQCAAEF